MIGPKECSVQTCDRPRRSSGAEYCETHYYRMRRTRTTEPRPRVQSAPRTASVRRQPGPCVIEGCAKTDCGPHGWCPMHYTRWARHGDPVTKLPSGRLIGQEHPNWVGDDATDSGIHMRLRSLRGNASGHTCTCGRPAAQWSYDHTDTNEKTSNSGPYSTDLDRYVPLCVPCHKRGDLDHLRNERGAA